MDSWERKLQRQTKSKMEMNKDVYYMLIIDVQYLLSIYANDLCAIFTLNINTTVLVLMLISVFHASFVV